MFLTPQPVAFTASASPTASASSPGSLPPSPEVENRRYGFGSGPRASSPTPACPLVEHRALGHRATDEVPAAAHALLRHHHRLRDRLVAPHRRPDVVRPDA